MGAWMYRMDRILKGWEGRMLFVVSGVRGNDGGVLNGAVAVHIGC